jgi:ornithine cyclodeaminase/alanine dehydrogenase
MDEKLSARDGVRVLNASFIKGHVSMGRAIVLMEEAFRILSDRSAYIPQRVIMPTPDDKMSVFFKPAFVSQYKRMSIKILTQIHSNENSEIPTIKGTVLLIDMSSGEIISMADGNYITALRTGAASGIATRYLANPDASSLAIFGCGAQGLTQMEAILAVRPIRTIYLFDQSEKRANCIAEALQLMGKFNCQVNPDLKVLKKVDVICTATPSHHPLFTVNHLKPGVHINAIGSYRPDMNEIDPEILRVGLTYLDDAPACLKESGDLIVPLTNGIIKENDITGEIGELISGKISGRKTPEDITLFKSVGNAIQDFFIANEAFEQSILSGGAQIIHLTD